MHFQGIRPGDLVTYVTPQGNIEHGRAQALLCFPLHVVVDAGDGRPVVVNIQNYIAHRAPRRLRAHRRTTP